jgi:hypothetical protein
MTDALMTNFLDNHPVHFVESTWEAAEGDAGFSELEETVITERLKRLGYL